MDLQKAIRLFLYLTIGLLFVANVFFLIMGTIYPETLKIGSPEASGTRKSMITWILYHGWALATLIFAIYFKRKKSMLWFIFCVILSLVLLYYPFLT
jgi:hypothetical protein